MRVSYGAGVIVAILAPFVVYLFELQDLNLTLFEVLLLIGIWTVASSFFLRAHERNMYLIIGVLLAFISTAFIIPTTYAIALTLIGIIVGVIVVSTTRNK